MSGFDDDNSSSWTQYQKLVLAELKRNSEELKSMNAKLVQLEIELNMLKVKSGFFGAAAGLVPIFLEKMFTKG